MVQKHLNHKNECHTVSLVWHFFSKGEEKAEKKIFVFPNGYILFYNK